MKKLRLNFKVLLTLLCLIVTSVAYGGSKQKFTLATEDVVAQIYVSQSEPAPVMRAVGDLQNDIKMVTGKSPEVVHSLDKLSRNSIIVGTLDNTEIKTLMATNRLAEANAAKGKYDSFLLKSVDKLVPQSAQSLVVVGSDALGAVYGVYEISKRIGVSPAYWWCDIPVKREKEVVLSDVLTLPKQPSVRYRGVFINDEEAMIQWSRFTSKQRDKGHISPELYKRVFEYLLRNRANLLWPGMIETGSYFFKYRDEYGVPINPKNATEYGLFIGASHCEQMGRNNYDEWYDWADQHVDMYDAKGTPEWDYSVNPKAIEAYWMERLKEAKQFNMIYTLGIRGVHDTPFFARNLKDQSLKSKVELIQRVIDRQREMIKEVYGSADAVPQVFVPYEETGELYNGESKDGREKCTPMNVPQDVIVVYTEDNHGFARQFATPKERARKGGLGIYYHFCYQGSPAQYNWLSTTPFILQREEYNKIYDGGAKSLWIVNVGDLKPSEFAQRYFFEFSNDVERFRERSTRDFVSDNAKTFFNIKDEASNETADILTQFYQFASAMRPEFLIPFGAAEEWGISKIGQGNWGSTFPTFQYYSLFDFGDEAQGRIEFIKGLESRAKAQYDALDEEYKESYYHLVYYPVRSARLMYEKTIYYRKNRLYARQGRLASVNAYKAMSEAAEQDIQADLHYYNKVLAGGKWDGIMDPYANYNIIERVFDISQIHNTFTYDSRYEEQQVKGIGAVCEGQVVGDEQVALRYSSFEDNRRFIDIFNREIKPNGWSIESDKPFVKFSKSSGQVVAEQRLTVSIDWTQAKVGQNEATITVKDGSGKGVKSFKLLATKFDLKLQKDSYVEGCGFVVIEAENYTKTVKGVAGSHWSETKNFGHVGSSMIVRGKSKVTQNHLANSARLEYRVYFETAGTHYGNIYRIPTLNEGHNKSCEIGIGVDAGAPQIIGGIRRKSQSQQVKMLDGSKEGISWHRNVYIMMEKLPFKIKVDKAGYHTIKLYGVDENIGVDRIVITTDEQAYDAHHRSLTSAPESYQNIGGYSSPKVNDAPEISQEIARVTPYPQIEAPIYAKFLFCRYGMPEVFNFTPVSKNHIFDRNINLFGWDAKSVNNVKSGHNESTRFFPFWLRDRAFGQKPATFHARLMKGDYWVTIKTGDIMNYSNNKPGTDYKMSLTINGVKAMESEVVKQSDPIIKVVKVRVGDDELMNFDFDGPQWGVSVVEIYRL